MSLRRRFEDRSILDRSVIVNAAMRRAARKLDQDGNSEGADAIRAAIKDDQAVQLVAIWASDAMSEDENFAFAVADGGNFLVEIFNWFFEHREELLAFILKLIELGILF